MQQIGSWSSSPDALSNIRRVEHVHDGDGIAIEESEVATDGSTTLRVARTVRKGLVERVELFDGEGRTVSITEHEYKGSDRVVDRLLGPAGDEVYTIRRTFDGRGNMTSEETTYPDGTVFGIDNVYQGRRITSTESTSGDTVTYTYPNSGGPGWQRSGSDGSVATFDALGRLIEHQGPSDLGGVLVTSSVTQVWGDDHALLTSTMTEFDGSEMPRRRTVEQRTWEGGRLLTTVAELSMATASGALTSSGGSAQEWSWTCD